MIVSEKTMNEIKEVLNEFDTFLDSYAHQIDSCSDGDWFVGITIQYLGGTEDLVHEIDSDFFYYIHERNYL